MNSTIEKRNVTFDILFNEIANGRVSHAYLIDENNNSDAYKLVIKFIKEILCNNREKKCTNCSICQRIDDNNYPEFRIIEPDGMYIKKQQLVELQQYFSRFAVEGKKRVYLIKDCDMMRPEAANSLLKFLEEPENDIVAILMTNNFNNVLPTIVSRCQYVKFNGEFNLDDNNKNNEYYEMMLSFIYDLAIDKRMVILNKKNYFGNNDILKNRDLLLNLMDLLIGIFYDILKIKNNINSNSLIINDKLLKISDIFENNRILNDINYLILLKDSIKFNVNVALFFDDLILNI